MRTEITYIADDGTKFDNLKACEDYEKEGMTAMKAAKELKDYCTAHSCSNCILHNSDGCMVEVPCDWKLDKSGD